MEIIAEVKTHSPFGYRSDKTWQQLLAIAEGVGSVLSIHTDSRWHGSFDLIAKVRALTSKPILAKGIHGRDADIEQAIRAGADYVLVVGRIPGVHLDKCFLEPRDLDELGRLPAGCKAVWNSRDLENGQFKTETFSEARRLHAGWLCQASNIRTIDDIEVGADAILVGEHLPEFARSYKASLRRRNNLTVR